MPRHVHDDLLALALGVAPAGTRNHVELHLLSCAVCTGALARTRDDAARLALALPPSTPSAPMREQLMHAAGEVDRFTDFVAPLSRLLALPRAAVERLFGRIDQSAPWVQDRTSGTARCPVPEREDASLLRVASGRIVAGTALGAAATVLQGRCQALDGVVYGAGATIRSDVARRPRGLLALPGPDVICLVTGSRPAAVGRAGRTG